MAVLPNQREFVRRPGALTPHYGLFNVAMAMGTLSDALPIHARQGGLEYITSVCDQPTCFETNCITTLGTKPAGEPYSVITGDPFVVLTSLLCGSVGMTAELMREMLRERALAGEQMRVEQVFSEGDCGQAPSLANNAVPATDVGPAANVVLAFSQLEQAFYSQYGLPGVIHIPYAAMPFVVSQHLIEQDTAGIWRTPTGTYVSVGNYSGLGPAGEIPAAGVFWFYITSQVGIWRTPESDVFYTPFEAALTRSTNQINAFREREYVLAFECTHFATETTLAGI